MDSGADRTPVLELRQATVSRRGRRILDGVTLSIGPGDHTALVGPNGSGKSTLIKLLTHEHYPLAAPNGAPPVRVFGRERWNVSSLRSRLGIVSPDLQHRFVSGTSTGFLCGLDAVVSGFFASEVVWKNHEVTDAMREAARGALARMQATHLASRSLETLSTGEARRVLIARALASEPRVLVLDEPTSGLDLVARRDFLHLLRQLAGQELTIVLITHQVEEILPEIRRVVLLREGRVVHDGPKREVLTAGRLREAFGSPVVVRERHGYYSLRLDGPAEWPVSSPAAAG